MVFQTSTSSTPNAHQAPGRQSRSSTHPNPPDPPWEIFRYPPLTSRSTRLSTSLDPACAFVRSPFLQLPPLACLHRDALAPFPSLPDDARSSSPAHGKVNQAARPGAAGTPPPATHSTLASRSLTAPTHSATSAARLAGAGLPITSLQTETKPASTGISEILPLNQFQPNNRSIHANH
jgi:hypothetical protein